MDKLDEIKKAYAALSVLPNKANRIEEMADEIVRIDTNYKGYIGFKKIGKNTCQKELQKVGKLAEKLAYALSQLHEPSIYALSKAEFAKFGPGYLYDPNNDRILLHELCEKIADAAKKADISKVPLKVGAGRPEAFIANDMAKLLSSHYGELTGKNPTVPNHLVKVSPNTQGNKAYGEFLELVNAIFKLMQINASAEAAARLAIKKEPVEVKEKNTSKKEN